MKNSISKIYYTLFFLLVTFVGFAADPGADDGTGTLEGTDAPAPIGDYIWVLGLLGILFVFMKLRAIQKNKIQE